MFGIETVVVLLMCVMSAYFLGSALSSLLPEDSLLLFNMTAETPTWIYPESL